MGMYNKRDDNRRNGNFNGNAKRKSKEEYEAEKAAKIAKQTELLNELADACCFYDACLDDETKVKVTMKEVLDYLNNKGYTADSTKSITQLNYVLLDLVNARKNKMISGDRLNIRVLYVNERFKSTFKKELHERISSMMAQFSKLFSWDETASGESFQPIEKE